MNRRDFLKLSATAAALGAAPFAPAQPQEKHSPIKVILWCWDARMTWDDEPQTVQPAMAAAEKKFVYSKRPESYLVGFKRLVDYCAGAGIPAVIIWGFLRDAHGGVAAAQDLCKYARDKGVAILPGVGLCSYGGYYYDGQHPFNLDTYFKEHPERASEANEDGGSKRHVAPVLDPAIEANQQWWREGLEWMLDTFEIGGIDFEMGDFIVNTSAAAQQARKALGFDADGNILDMVVATRALMERAYALRPDGLFINALYRGYERITGFPNMPYVSAMPKQTIWEYTLTGMVRRPEFPKGYAGVPDHRRYGYLHWFNVSTKTVGKDYVADIARVLAGLHELHFEFVGTYGELSAVNDPIADRNYRAQVAWGADPTLKLEDFT